MPAPDEIIAGLREIAQRAFPIAGAFDPHFLDDRSPLACLYGAPLALISERGAPSVARCLGTSASVGHRAA